MAVNNIFFVSWNRPVAGKEAIAFEHFNQCISFLGKQQTAGHIESYEPALLDYRGGEMNGFIIIRGDRARIMNMCASEEWMDLAARASCLVTNFSAVFGEVNDAMKNRMVRFVKMAR